MDKNTIIAIVLSTLVLIGSMFVQTKVVGPKQQAAQAKQAAEKQAEREAKAIEAAEQNSHISANLMSEMESADNSEEIPVQEYTITTSKIKAVFTNKGGDIISYQLLEHSDKDTGKGVEMCDNATERNRAFSLSFGGAENQILNDTFKVTLKDDNTILFYRDYDVKDDNGNIRKITLGKRYSFLDDEYTFKLDISIVTEDGAVLDFGDAGYSLRTSPQIGPHFDRKNRYEVRQYLALNGNKRVRKMVSDKDYSASYDWVGIAGKYFTTLVKPASTVDVVPISKVSTKSETNYENAQLFISAKPVRESRNDSYFIYIGPRSERELIKYNEQGKNSWGLSNAKFNEALQTSGFFSWIEIALKWSLEKINIFARNWGLSIVILTIILKIILFPLNKKQAEGSIKMQQLQPRMQAIQAKYGNDQQKQGIEMQKLYKEVGYNPMSGCLPMVFQMFILFAMYNVFNNYFEFRGASFITGWIDDLSVGDSIWTWKKEIPVISGFTMNNLRLLPFIYTGSQLLNGKITQFGNPTGGANQSQMKMMMYGMPILFFFMFYNVPSGLLLYWTVSNVLQIGQQLVINAAMKKKRAEVSKSEKPVNKNELKFNGGKKKTR